MISGILWILIWGISLCTLVEKCHVKLWRTKGFSLLKDKTLLLSTFICFQMIFKFLSAHVIKLSFIIISQISNLFKLIFLRLSLASKDITTFLNWDFHRFIFSIVIIVVGYLFFMHKWWTLDHQILMLIMNLTRLYSFIKMLVLVLFLFLVIILMTEIANVNIVILRYFFESFLRCGLRLVLIKISSNGIIQ